MNKVCIFEIDYGNCIEGIEEKELLVIPRIGELINIGQKYYEVIMVVHDFNEKARGKKKFDARIYVKPIEDKARFPYLPPLKVEELYK